MADYSKYLIIEEPLVVMPTIARVLDINKAIILQQVQYWILKSKHERDGYAWIWNSYAEWAKQFPWLTARAVRHHIAELEKMGLLVSGEYNRDRRDNTKWYRIDYAAVDQYIESATDSSCGLSTSGTPRGKGRQVHVARTVTPLPETTPETTPIDNKRNNDRLDEHDEYEKQLGVMLTPIVMEAITAYVTKCPEGWVSKAIEIAAKAGAHNWRYPERILDNWLAAGTMSLEPPGKQTKHGGPGAPVETSQDIDKYTRGRFGHIVDNQAERLAEREA